MFRKRKEPARDNTESQVTMEQIRRRMVANVAGAETPSQIDAGPETALAIDAVCSEYPALPRKAPSYDSAVQNLREATEIGDLIAQANHEGSSRNGGRGSISGMLRNSMRWYTAPEEAYWHGVLGSMDRILSALKAHDAVVQIHADAMRSAQEHSAALTRQLSEISDMAISNPKDVKEQSES
jgi:hypothetical protein